MRGVQRPSVGEGLRPLMRGCLPALLIAMTLGCAGLGSVDTGSDGAPDGSEVMSQSRMEILFSQQVEKIEGPPGALRSVVAGWNVYLISDPENDRMRIVVPCARVDAIDQRYLVAMLESNFHRSLDARYAISEGIVHSVYLHPISTLTPGEIVSAYEQVMMLARSFGTTFSSGKSGFGPRPRVRR